MERWAQINSLGSGSKEDHDPHSTPDGFLKYGVYILDANAERLERDLPWLIVRKDGECAGDCEHADLTRSESVRCPLGGAVTHGLTETTDGRLVGELEIEARLAQEQAERSSASVHPNLNSVPSLTQSSVNARIHRCKRANIIDFAQREKDEMRDLTRASEILSVWGSDARDLQVVCVFLLFSLFRSSVVPQDEASGSTTATYWNPNAGQVFLGNASDVPMWKPPAIRRGHSQSHFGPAWAANPITSAYIDPFADPYGADDSAKPSPLNTYTNDPSYGLGFDICIECHEHAPLPSLAHLRAAEEHVRMMEVEWAEEWCRRWDQQGSRASFPSDLSIPSVKTRN